MNTSTNPIYVGLVIVAIAVALLLLFIINLSKWIPKIRRTKGKEEKEEIPLLSSYSLCMNCAKKAVKDNVCLRCGQDQRRIR